MSFCQLRCHSHMLSCEWTEGCPWAVPASLQCGMLCLRLPHRTQDMHEARSSLPSLVYPADRVSSAHSWLSQPLQQLPKYQLAFFFPRRCVPGRNAAWLRSAVITLVELPLRHDVWRRHFRLHLRMERLDVPSKRLTFQLAKSSLGNGGITSAPNHVLVVLVARWGETEKEVYPKAADNDSGRWSKHPCELSKLSGLVPESCYDLSSAALHQGGICKDGGTHGRPLAVKPLHEEGCVLATARSSRHLKLHRSADYFLA